MGGGSLSSYVGRIEGLMLAGEIVMIAALAVSFLAVIFCIALKDKNGFSRAVREKFYSG